MYEELVKRLRDISNSDSNIKSNYIGLTMIQAADAIEELQRQIDAWVEPERKALIKSLPKWIPVAERLPENNTRILIVTKSRNGRYWIDACRFTNNLHEFDEYDFPNETRPGFFRYDNEYGWTEITDVTHWMPLPTPPKEE